jgi:hypothetical protein
VDGGHYPDHGFVRDPLAAHPAEALGQDVEAQSSGNGLPSGEAASPIHTGSDKSAHAV